MEKLFIADSLQQQIDKDGLLTLPFLNEEELAQINDFFYELHPEGVVPEMRDGIHMTLWCSDRAYKIHVRNKLNEMLNNACNRVFVNYRKINACFIVKSGGQQTTFQIHQDWSIVDEEKHRAFNLWIPLHEVDNSNGALWVVKGSHKMTNYVRGAGVLFPDLMPVRDKVKEVMTSVDVEAGTALIFYHRAIHGSPPNMNEKPRVAVALSIVPKDVPLQIAFQKDTSAPLELYEPTDDFIYNYDNVRDDTSRFPPVGEEPVVIKEAQAPFTMTADMFDAFYYGKELPEAVVAEAEVATKKNWWRRLVGKVKRVS